MIAEVRPSFPMIPGLSITGLLSDVVERARLGAFDHRTWSRDEARDGSEASASIGPLRATPLLSTCDTPPMGMSSRRLYHILCPNGKPKVSYWKPLVEYNPDSSFLMKRNLLKTWRTVGGHL